MAGVEAEAAADAVLLAEDSGPLYGADEMVLVAAIAPTGKPLVPAVLAAGVTDDRLVV